MNPSGGRIGPVFRAIVGEVRKSAPDTSIGRCVRLKPTPFWGSIVRFFSAGRWLPEPIQCRPAALAGASGYDGLPRFLHRSALGRLSFGPWLLSASGGLSGEGGPPPLPVGGESIPPPLPGGRESGPPPISRPGGTTPPPLPKTGGAPPPRISGGAIRARVRLGPPKRWQSIVILAVILVLLGGATAAYFLLGLQYPPQVRKARTYYKNGKYLAAFMTLDPYISDIERPLGSNLEDVFRKMLAGEEVSLDTMQAKRPHPEAYYLIGGLRLLHEDDIRQAVRQQGSERLSLLPFSTGLNPGFDRGRADLGMCAKLGPKYQGKVAVTLDEAIRQRFVEDLNKIRTEAEKVGERCLAERKYEQIGRAFDNYLREQKARQQQINLLINDLARYEGLLAANWRQKQPAEDALESAVRPIREQWQWNGARRSAEEIRTTDARRAAELLKRFIQQNPNSPYFAAAQQELESLKTQLLKEDFDDLTAKTRNMEPRLAEKEWNRFLAREELAKEIRAAANTQIQELRAAAQQKLESLKSKSLKEDFDNLTAKTRNMEPRLAEKEWNRFLAREDLSEEIRAAANTQIQEMRLGAAQQVFDEAEKISEPFENDTIAQIAYWKKFLEDHPDLQVLDQAQRQLEQAEAKLEAKDAGYVIDLYGTLASTIPETPVKDVQDRFVSANLRANQFLADYPDSKMRAQIVEAADGFQQQLLQLADKSIEGGETGKAGQYCRVLTAILSGSDSPYLQRANALLSQIAEVEKKTILPSVSSYVPGKNLKRSAQSEFLDQCGLYLSEYGEGPPEVNLRRRFTQVSSAAALAEDWKSMPVRERFEQETRLAGEWPPEWRESKATIDGWIERDKPEYWRTCILPNVAVEIQKLVTPENDVEKAREEIEKAQTKYKDFGPVVNQDLNKIKSDLPYILEKACFDDLDKRWTDLSIPDRIRSGRIYLRRFPSSLYRSKVEVMLKKERAAP